LVHRLIDPEPLADVGLFLEAARAIVTGEYGTQAPGLGPQRYIVKEPWRADGGYRALLAQRLRERLGFASNPAWQLLTVTSGTAALRLAARALLPGRGAEQREVLIPAVTVANTAEALIAEGYVPVLVDVDPQTWLIDLESAQRALSPRTIGLVSVDWLGTSAAPGPLRAFCDGHGLRWISDSAQSFGVEREGVPPVLHADATIFSTGYPKVFHTGGRGGLLVIGAAGADALVHDPGGSLRNEPLPELQCLAGLLALQHIDAQLAQRRALGECYVRALEPARGIEVQRVADPNHTNRYQLSVRVIGHSPADLVAHSAALGAEASIERVPCLDQHPLLANRVTKRVPLTVSRALAASSLTLPMPRGLSLDAAAAIGAALVARCERRVWSVHPAPEPPAATASILAQGLGAERYWSIEPGPVAYRGVGGESRVAPRVLAPPDVMTREKLSSASVLAAISSSATLEPRTVVVPPLIVRAICPDGSLALDTHVDGPIAECSEAGSSADVNFCLGADGTLAIEKRCAREGIDGNGRPWLERQYEYLTAPEFGPVADLFVRPTSLRMRANEVTVELPYLHSVSLAEHLLAGGDPDYALGVIGDLIGHLASRVWSAGTIASDRKYLQRVHLERMHRRLAIVADRHSMLREALALDQIVLDDTPLLGFSRVCEHLVNNPVWNHIEPRRLGLLHGDLNLFNILCLREPGHVNRFRLIDPRGTQLWDHSSLSAGPERGDYSYDLGKIAFSLGGFVAIRAGMVGVHRLKSKTYQLVASGNQLGAPGLLHCAEKLIDLCVGHPALALLRAESGDSDETLAARIALAEAANFVADAACALGRDCTHEVMPLFLTGLAALNAVVKQFERPARKCRRTPAPTVVTQPIGPVVGLTGIRTGLMTQNERPRWDVIEVLIRRAAMPLARRILERARGVYLPRNVAILVGHHAPPAPRTSGPCVIIHSVDVDIGPVAALTVAITRTHALLPLLGWPTEADDRRILTLLPGRSCDAVFDRCGEPLVAAAPRDQVPLLQLLAAAHQLEGPPGGRWVLTGNGILLAAQPVVASGDRIALLGQSTLIGLYVPDSLTTPVCESNAVELLELAERFGVEHLDAGEGTLVRLFGRPPPGETSTLIKRHWATFDGLPLAVLQPQGAEAFARWIDAGGST